MFILFILFLVVITVHAQDQVPVNYTKVFNNTRGSTPCALSYNDMAVTYCFNDSAIVVNKPVVGNSIDQYGGFGGGVNVTCSATEKYVFRANDTHLLILDRKNTEKHVTPLKLAWGGLRSLSEVDDTGTRIAACLTTGDVLVFHSTSGEPFEPGYIHLGVPGNCIDVSFTRNSHGVRTLVIPTEAGDVRFMEETTPYSFATSPVTVPFSGAGNVVIKTAYNNRVYLTDTPGVISVIEYNGTCWETKSNQGTGEIISWDSGKNDTSFFVFTGTGDPGLELKIFADLGVELLSPVVSEITSIQFIAAHSKDEAYIVDQDGNLFRFGVIFPTRWPTLSPTDSPTDSPVLPLTHAPTHGSSNTNNVSLVVGLSAIALVIAAILVYIGVVFYK
jgi:hypothetical protein